MKDRIVIHCDKGVYKGETWFLDISESEVVLVNALGKTMATCSPNLAENMIIPLGSAPQKRLFVRVGSTRLEFDSLTEDVQKLMSYFDTVMAAEGSARLRAFARRALGFQFLGIIIIVGSVYWMSRVDSQKSDTMFPAFLLVLGIVLVAIGLGAMGRYFKVKKLAEKSKDRNDYQAQ
ncbi:MAG: hypothetical protein ABFD92_17560 [Planctomycetaceae bacterium]|nr:hypothetical protein [Planctomycetaceae bacterium]